MPGPLGLVGLPAEKHRRPAHVAYPFRHRQQRSLDGMLALTVVNQIKTFPSEQGRVEIKPRPERTVVVQNENGWFSFRLLLELCTTLSHVPHTNSQDVGTPPELERGWTNRRRQATTTNTLEGCEYIFILYPDFSHRT